MIDWQLKEYLLLTQFTQRCEEFAIIVKTKKAVTPKDYSSRTPTLFNLLKNIKRSPFL